MTDRVTPEEVARLRALIAEQAAEIARLRHLEDIVRDEHEDCQQYRDWLANPVRSGRCHVCDLLNRETP